MIRERGIKSITFEDEGVVINYITPKQDIKANGVVVNHVLLVPYDDDYEDEIEALFEASHALLEDVLEDLPQLDPMPELEREEEPDDDNDDDD